MRALRVRPLLAVLGCALVAALPACGGGGGSAPTTSPSPGPPTPAPVTVPATAGATAAMLGYAGATFAFTFGSGATAGELFRVAHVPDPMYPPCQGTGCAAVAHPIDAVALSAGSDPLPLASIARVTVSGVSGVQSIGSTDVLDIRDLTVDEGETRYTVPTTGGPLSVAYTFPAGTPPIVALQPGRQYLLTLW